MRTTTPHFETLNDLFAATEGRQINAQEIFNGRAHVFGQWQEITVSDALRNEVVEHVASSANARGNNKFRVLRCLRNERPQHWTLERFFLDKYGDRPARLSYCAGQDMTYEMAQLRKKLVA
tara:strand:- start:1266 stop:1628 length:363 start_codon:yes stop_codon:yes gene_type:complete